MQGTRGGVAAALGGARRRLDALVGQLSRAAGRVAAPRHRAGKWLRRAWWRYARVPDALLLPALYRLARAVERGGGVPREGRRRPADGGADARPGGHLVLWLVLAITLGITVLADVWLLGKILPGFARDVVPAGFGGWLAHPPVPAAPVVLACLVAGLGFLTAALDRYNDDSLTIALLRLVPLLLLVSLMALHGGAAALWVGDRGILDALRLPARGPLRPAVQYGGPALAAMIPPLVMALAYGAWRAFLGFISDVPALVTTPRLDKLDAEERELLEALRATLAARGRAPIYRWGAGAATAGGSGFASSAPAGVARQPGATETVEETAPWPVMAWHRAAPQLVIQLLLFVLAVGTLAIVVATLSGSLAARAADPGFGSLLPWGVALATYLATYLAAEARWSSESAVLAALGLREARGRAVLGGVALLLATVGWSVFAWVTLTLRPLGPSLGLAIAAVLLVTLTGVLSAARIDRALASLAYLVVSLPGGVAWLALAAAELLVFAAAGLALIARGAVTLVAWPIRSAAGTPARAGRLDLSAERLAPRADRPPPSTPDLSAERPAPHVDGPPAGH